MCTWQNEVSSCCMCQLLFVNSVSFCFYVCVSIARPPPKTQTRKKFNKKLNVATWDVLIACKVHTEQWILYTQFIVTTSTGTLKQTSCPSECYWRLHGTSKSPFFVTSRAALGGLRAVGRIKRQLETERRNCVETWLHSLPTPCDFIKRFFHTNNYFVTKRCWCFAVVIM